MRGNPLKRSWKFNEVNYTHLSLSLPFTIEYILTTQPHKKNFFLFTCLTCWLSHSSLFFGGLVDELEPRANIPKYAMIINFSSLLWPTCGCVRLPFTFFIPFPTFFCVLCFTVVLCLWLSLWWGNLCRSCWRQSFLLIGFLEKRNFVCFYKSV